MMNKQRRLFQRIHVELPMSMHVGRFNVRGVTTNISMNGLFVHLDEAECNNIYASQQGKCQLEFRGVHLTLNCEVLRREGKEVALQFTDFSPEAFAALRSLMNFTVATTPKKPRRHWLTQAMGKGARIIPLFPDVAFLEGQKTP